MALPIRKCKDCGVEYEPRYEWATMCFHCYKLWKAKTDPQVKIEYVTKTTRIPDVDGKWLRSNIKSILNLCHPDRHNNSETSNTITRELVRIFKQEKSK